MFWVLYLPLIIGFVVWVLYTILDEDGLVNWDAIKTSAIVFIFLVIFLGLISFTYSSEVPAEYVYLDEQKITILPLPDQDGKYLIITDDLRQGRYVTFLFQNENNLSEILNLEYDEVQIVEDNPDQPYYQEVLQKCADSYFWILLCGPGSPYDIQVHVPEGSIIYIKP